MTEGSCRIQKAALHSAMGYGCAYLMIEIDPKQWEHRDPRRAGLSQRGHHSIQTAAQCGPRLGSPCLSSQGSSAENLAQRHHEPAALRVVAASLLHQCLGLTDSAEITQGSTCSAESSAHRCHVHEALLTLVAPFLHQFLALMGSASP